MAATVGGALKAYLETKGLGVAIFVRRAPPDQALPYVTITEGISTVAETHEDGGAAQGGTTPVAEELQVDLWMYDVDPTTGARTESYTLPYSLARALAGADLGSFGTPARRMYGCKLTDGPRELGDPNDPNLLRKTFAVMVQRET